MNDKPMIMTITGDLGSGKSTVSKILAKKLGLQRYSTGDLQRQLAQDKGITSLELNKMAETQPEIDEQIDRSTVTIAAQHTHIIIDSRLAWHFVPAAYKLYLTVDPTIAASRILGSQRGNVERYHSLAEACEKLAQRRASEEHRFKTLYGADLTDFRNYDTVIDTTFATPAEITEKVIEQFQLWSRSEIAIRVWCNPKRLLPTRDVSEIGSEAGEPCLALMRTHGHDTRCPVKILPVDGYFYIMDGHARVSAALAAQVAFCPCVIAATGEERAIDSLTAREYVAGHFTPRKARAWEEAHGFTFPSDLPASCT